MRTIEKDRAALRCLVESYGKEDVMKYVNHLNEAIDESQTKKDAIMKAFNEIVIELFKIYKIDIEQDSPDDLMRILEELYDVAADEGCQLGYDEGYQRGYSDCEDEYEDAR